MRVHDGCEEEDKIRPFYTRFYVFDLFLLWIRPGLLGGVSEANMWQRPRSFRIQWVQWQA